jgi:hypothetical protein
MDYTLFMNNNTTFLSFQKPAGYLESSLPEGAARGLAATTLDLLQTFFKIYGQSDKPWILNRVQDDRKYTDINLEEQKK